MNEIDFLKILAHTIDTEDILQMNTSLTDVLEWDSVGILSFMMKFNNGEDSDLTLEMVRQAVVVKDLYDMANKYGALMK